MLPTARRARLPLLLTVPSASLASSLSLLPTSASPAVPLATLLTLPFTPVSPALTPTVWTVPLIRTSAPPAQLLTDTTSMAHPAPTVLLPLSLPSTLAFLVTSLATLSIKMEIVSKSVEMD